MLGEAIENQALLLLGDTKAGKTTLMYYLLGKKLLYKYDEKNCLHYMQPESVYLDASISSDAKSETVYPNIFLSESQITIIDMPGFNDNRNLERILNIYITK
eukprot:GHVR01100511.1.p1 GENE.GHVR01100511.1~~GHVR01100511.1.p1  ORF type:complete len:102 (+),score=2.56 GHVR01100511.1:713-1018(+)